MSRKPRHKAKSPEQIQADKIAARQRDLAAVNMPDDAASLPNHDDVQVVREGQGRGTQTASADLARRLDAFEALREGMRHTHGAYDSARRLEHNIRVRFGEADQGRSLMRVDCDDPKAKGRLDSILDAGDEVDGVLGLVGERDAWLLTELIRPQARFSTWREIVAYVTAETHEHAQGAAVRAACANLAAAYRVYDRMPKVRRRAAA
jgi:hypothetical protein